MPKVLDDGREVENVSTYELDSLDEHDFREVLVHLMRDVLDITTIQLVRYHGRIQNINFTKGD